MMDITIAVIDTGIGIPEEKREKIFHKFIQADSSTTRKYGGTGLGLSISKTLVEAMHGKLWVEEAPGGGSKFTIQLSLPVAANLSEPAVTVIQNQIHAPENKVPPQHLLIVEDHKDNILVLTSFLERMGHSYELAKTGKEAITKWKAGTFDAILIDIQMPEMDGLKATQHIRQQEKEAKQSPIIGITAYALAGDRERCIAAGMDHYIAKPFEPEQLEIILKFYNSAPLLALEVA